jgi:hypothetical protein
MGPITKQINSVHAIRPYIYDSFLYYPLKSRLSFKMMLYAFLISSACATCLPHLKVHDLARVYSVKSTKLLSSSLWNFHYPAVIPFPLSPIILISTFFSDTLST